VLLLPFQLNDREYSVFVVLQDDNLSRLREHDPAEVNIGKMGQPWSALKLRDVIIGYASETDTADVYRLCEANRSDEALKYLSRGFAFHPDRGDHDDAYPSALKTNG